VGTARTVGHTGRFWAPVQNQYVHRLIDEYTVTCIRRLTNEYIGPMFIGCLDLCRFRYQGAIFLGTEEYIDIVEETMFSCSVSGSLPD
jgi:hypothetical protein